MTQEHYARIADIYDKFVVSDFDIDYFLDAAKSANGKVLELMSGTGRVSIPLVEAGIELTCVDYSQEMIDILSKKLKQKSLQAETIVADIRDFELGQQFDLIFIPFHAFPEITDRDNQLEALKAIERHLIPDGTFICTLHNPLVRRKSVDNQLRLAGKFPTETGQMFVWLHQRFINNTDLVEVLEFFEEYDSTGNLQSKRYSELIFSLLEKSDFEQLIEEAGFVVKALYGNYAKSPFDEEQNPVLIWELQKKKN